jgi:SAM-dependent methyltransferase
MKGVRCARTLLEVGDAARRWAEQLIGWAVPEDILAQAPEPPWGFLPGMFTVDDDEVVLDVPSRRIALEALGAGGSVLDVGSGGGSASLALVPALTSIVGVDERPEALDELRAAAARHDVPCEAVAGSWTAVAPEVPPADVVVCHHVLYNVPDAEPFVEELTSHARRLVVMELNAAHPLVYLAPLWCRFWGIERPNGPTAADAVVVVRELGIEPHVALGERPGGHWRSPDQQVRLARKRLCLPASRDAEIAEALAELPPATPQVWTIAWPGTAA